MTPDHDVIIIGGGHNGLVAAGIFGGGGVRCPAVGAA